MLPSDEFLENCRLTDSLDAPIFEVKRHSCTNATPTSGRRFSRVIASSVKLRMDPSVFVVVKERDK